MRRHVAALFVTGIALLGPVAVRADQVVYFTNGTSMQIQSHTLEGAMIRVDLGGGALVGFPNSLVERIEDRGRSVYTNPAFKPSNQAVAGSSGAVSMPEPDTTAIAGVSPGARFRPAGPRPAGGYDPNNPLVQAAFGEAGVPSRPDASSVANGRVKVRGRMSPQAAASAPLGANVEGGNFAIPTPGGRPRAGVTTLQPRSGTMAPPPPEPPSLEPPPVSPEND